MATISESVKVRNSLRPSVATSVTALRVKLATGLTNSDCRRNPEGTIVALFSGSLKRRVI